MNALTRMLWEENDDEPNSTPADPTARTSKRTSPQGADPDHPLTISQLNARIKKAIDDSLPAVWVEGEVSDLSRPSSGHLYFTLKDEQSQVRAVLWRSSAARLGFQLEDGQSLLCQGQLDVYSPRGTYQIVVQRAQPKGLGPLQIAFRQLYEKLAKEGLFRDDRKKLPRFPRRIGFVTSPSGAAVRDFLEVLRRRWPDVHVIVIPAKVQGAGSATDIVNGILQAQQILPKLDVLVVGRGGGSLEDLWSFNEESVVRAIANCPLPTVSAVGHEIDVTLCDLAADVRALTPSEAAERILPNAFELREALVVTQSRITSVMLAHFRRYRQRLDAIASRSVIENPKEMLRRLAQRVDEWDLRCQMAVKNQLTLHRKRIDQHAATLDALSPLRVIRRGFSVTLIGNARQTLTSIEQVRSGNQIRTLLADGSIISSIESVESTPHISELPDIDRLPN